MMRTVVVNVFPPGRCSKTDWRHLKCWCCRQQFLQASPYYAKQHH